MHLYIVLYYTPGTAVGTKYQRICYVYDSRISSNEFLRSPSEHFWLFTLHHLYVVQQI